MRAKNMLKTFAWLAILLVAIGVGYTYFGYTTATLRLQIRDPPSGWGDATNINIHYSTIEIHRTDAGENSGWIKIGDEGSLDLSTVIDVEKTISETRMDPGTYNMIRFEIIDAKVTVGNLNTPASISSGKLKIQITGGGIKLEGGKTSSLIIDIEPTVIGSEKSGYRVLPVVKAELS